MLLQLMQKTKINSKLTEYDSALRTFINKSIDADSNTVTNIDDDEIKASAGIDAS